MTVTILVNNEPGEGLAHEHGLAFWIEAAGRRILFDTGQGEALPANVEALGIDLATADHVVLSHGHYDHGGALPYVLERATGATVHLHTSATQTRYSIHDGVVRSIGLTGVSLTALGNLPPERVVHADLAAELVPGVGLTGAVPRVTTFEDTGGPFFHDPHGEDPDLILDDLSLWIDTPRGLMVCLGCAHAGIINILTHIRQVTGERPIDTVIGGMHLVRADEHRLRETVTALRVLAPRRLVTCHCTGDRAAEYLATELGDMVTAGRSGQVWD